MTNKITYGIWRTEKAREEGYSHELISPDTRHILDRTDLDTLDALEYPGVNTLMKAFRRTLKRIPNDNWLGTRVQDEYKWISYR